MQKPEGHVSLGGGHTMERGWFDSLIAIHRRKLTCSFSWCIATRKSKSFVHTFYRSTPGALISLKSHLFLALGGGGETARPAGAFSEDLQARLFGISSQLTRSSRATMLWSEFCWNYSQQRLLGSQSLTLKGWVEWICWRLLVPF